MDKMKKTNPKLIDALLIGGMIAPVAVGALLKILLIPAPEGVEITGAHIFFTLPLPFGGLPITETQVNQWLVMISLFFVCLYLTRGLKKVPDLKRQHLAEWIVEQTEKLVKSNMGDYFADFAPFIGAVLGLSAFSSLLSLTGLFPPTSDLNVTAGWAILVFILITYYKMKCGPIRYLKSFAEPVPFLAPLNVISEFATPVSMAAQCDQRIRNARFHGVPSLRQHPLRHGHFRAAGNSAAGAFKTGSRLAPWIFGRNTAFPHRTSGGVLGLL